MCYIVSIDKVLLYTILNDGKFYTFVDENKNIKHFHVCSVTVYALAVIIWHYLSEIKYHLCYIVYLDKVLLYTIYNDGKFETITFVDGKTYQKVLCLKPNSLCTGSNNVGHTFPTLSIIVS